MAQGSSATPTTGDDPGVRLLRKLTAGNDLTVEESQEAVRGLMEERYPGPLAGALLTALSLKGESADELYSFASTLRGMARPFAVEGADRAIDLCGTGGAGKPTFNVSTVAAFVVAAAGLPVAKHGNTSARGACGSSDLLEALGLPVKVSAAFAEETFRKEGLGFLHAPLFHPATRGVAPIRRALGIRTIFNQLGPLTNPAGVKRQVVGSFSMEYGRKAVDVLARLGCTHVVAAHSDDGADEFSPAAPTNLIRSDAHGVTLERIDPESLLTEAERTGDWGPLTPPKAAEAAVGVLSGKEISTRTGSVLLTAGVALWIADMAEDIEGGIEAARGALASGGAYSKLESLRAMAQERDWTITG